MMSARNIAIAGHAGIGHVNGYGGFIQDDCAGFITTAYILKDLLNADTTIQKAEADPDTNQITITTKDGGRAVTSPRRGITPHEAKLIKNVIMKDALYCQKNSIEVFGRMYGQGVTETPVALSAAMANAVVDTFHKSAPDKFFITEESIELNSGLLGGIKTKINSVDVSLLVSVNYSAGGIGPVEDMEGNIPVGSKGDLMKKLDMLKCPTIVLESKAYSPVLSAGFKENTFLVRAQIDIDNKIVAESIVESAKEMNLPLIFRDDLLPIDKGFMKRTTVNLADQIIELGEKLKSSESAEDKVNIVAELARLTSEDAGAVTCISNDLHDIIRGAGIIPGTAAVLSMLVTKAYRDYWKIPLFDEQDAEKMGKIVMTALPKISSRIEEVYDTLERLYIDPYM
ncbi:hypothetical protein ACFLR4_01585 [Bacteroidota bacterium]